jgi:Tfp pilus assembly protein PilF
MASTLQQTLRRALSLYQDGRPHEAESLCDAVLVLEPDNVDALQITGLARLDLGMNAAACDAFEKAIALAPDVAVGHLNLATALLRLGKPAAALRKLERALGLQCDLPEAHYNLGNTLLALGHADEAEKAFEQAVSLRPDYADALNNLGQMLRDRGDGEGAARHFHRALDAAPAYGPAWSNLCGVLIDLGRAADAVIAGRRAALLLPGDARAHYNLGNAFAAALIPAEAAACYRRALRIDPLFTDAFVNLGAAQMGLGDTDGAVTAFEHALAIDAGLPEANWNKALALLLSGRWEDAWDLYEWRWRAVRELRLPEIATPMWDGGSGTDGTVLIRCEQGYGDAIQFVRYLPMVRARGWRVALECPPALERLFRDSAVADTVIAFGAPRPAFDCWLPVMSLARIFETSLGTVPADVPYLAAGAAPEWHPDTPGFTVGIVWQGSLTNGRGRYRSCTLADLLPLRRAPGVSLVSLQAQLSEEDLAALRRFGIPDLASGVRDFADSAALAQQVDLVIAVDTAMAHLAGALGRPVWTLLSAFPDWRWLLDRDDSPWYPGMRLFRQRRIGEWPPLVDEVASALSRYVREGGR